MLSHENAYFELLAANSLSAMKQTADKTSPPLSTRLPNHPSSESPVLPRPPPRPKPPRFLLKASESLTSGKLPAKSAHPYRNSFLEAQQPPYTLSPLTTPNKPLTFRFEPDQHKRSGGKPVDNIESNSNILHFMKSLNIEEESHQKNKHTSHIRPPLTPNHYSTPAPPSLSKLPIQELNGSPYSVKKKFRIGKNAKRNKYSPSHSPLPTPAFETPGAPSLTNFSPKPPSESPNHLSPVFRSKLKKKDSSQSKLDSVPDMQPFSSLPLRGPDTSSNASSRIPPSLLKSCSERTEPSPKISASPSFDTPDPSAADIGSLRLVAKLSTQFEGGPMLPRTRTRSNTNTQLERPSFHSRHAAPDPSSRIESFLDDYIMVDRPPTPPSSTSASGTVDNSSGSASEMEQLKERLRKIHSTDDLSQVLTSSNSTSVFIQDVPNSIPCTPVANPVRSRPWDQVNRAFGRLLGNVPPTYAKRSDLTQNNLAPAVTSAPVAEDEDDQGGAIIIRSRRPAHEIFRESVRIKKRERLMIASMTDSKKKGTEQTENNSVQPEPEGNCEQKMFLYVIVVSLTKQRSGEGYEPSISYRFPPMNDNASTGPLLAAVPQFCFPDARLWQPSSKKATHNHLSETYSFMLTDELGEKKFGYCRRIFPKGKDLPEVYCIISPLGCFSLYSSILDQVELGRSRSSALVYAFLRSVISEPLPLPGHSVSIQSMISQSRDGMDQIRLYRPQDSARLEHVNFSKLLCCLGVKLTLQLFAAILLERRIIFVAEQLSLLSNCCHAITALLYPFSWQHVFIPVLPEAMVHICCSPSPYIVGLLPSSLPTVLEFGEEMEEAVILSLDDRKFIRKAGDEESILPCKLQAALESVLKGCDNLESWRESPEMSDVVMEAFVRFFIEILDMYTEFTYQNSEDPTIIEFNTKAFLKTIKSKASRRFLSEFCKTQMFFNFLQEQGDNPEFSQSVKTLFQERYDEIMSSRVLSTKYGKECSKGLLKKFRLGKITGYAPGKSK